MSSKSSLRSARSTTSSSAGQTHVSSSTGSSASAGTRHRRGSASSSNSIGGGSRAMRTMEQERRLCRVPSAVMSASARLDAIRGRVTELQYLGERQWHTDVLDQAGGVAITEYFDDLRATVQLMQYNPSLALTNHTLDAHTRSSADHGSSSYHEYGSDNVNGCKSESAVRDENPSAASLSGPRQLRFMAQETERLLTGASAALHAVQTRSSVYSEGDKRSDSNICGNEVAEDVGNVQLVSVYPGMKERMLREARILLTELQQLLQHRPSQLVASVPNAELLSDLVSFHVDEFDAFAQYRLPALVDEMKMEGVYYSAAVMASASQRARPIGLTSIVVLDVAIGVRPVLCARIAIEHAKSMLNNVSHRLHSADAVLRYSKTHQITSHYATPDTIRDMRKQRTNSNHRHESHDRGNEPNDYLASAHSVPPGHSIANSSPDAVEQQRREYHVMKERLAQARSELDALGERWAAEEQAIFDRATSGMTDLATVWQTKRMQEDEVLTEVGCIYDRAVHICLPFACPQYHRRHGETYSQPCQVRVGLHFMPDSTPANAEGDDLSSHSATTTTHAASSSSSVACSALGKQQAEEEEESVAAAVVKDAIRRGRMGGTAHLSEATHHTHPADTRPFRSNSDRAGFGGTHLGHSGGTGLEGLTLYTLLPGFIPWMRQCGVGVSEYEHYAYLVPSREQLWLPFSEMPEMVKGARCALRGVHARLDHTRALEEHKEVGGYFILRGGERILRALLMQRCNVPINIYRERFSSQGPHFTPRAVVMRCKRASGLTTQNYFYYTTVGDVIFSFARKVVWHVPVTLLLFAMNPDGMSGLELFRLLTTGLPSTPEAAAAASTAATDHTVHASPHGASSSADAVTHAARVEALLQHHQQRPYSECVHFLDYLAILGRMYRSYHQNSNTFHFLPQFSQGLRCQHDAWYGLFMLRRHVLPHLNVRVATPDLRADASPAELRNWLMPDESSQNNPHHPSLTSHHASSSSAAAALLRRELAAKFAVLVTIVRQLYQFVDGTLAHQGNDVPAFQEIVPVSQVMSAAMEVCLTRALRGLAYRWGRHMPARVFTSALALRHAPLHVAEDVMRQLRELHEFSTRRAGGGGSGGEPLEPLHRLLTTGNFSLDREEDFYCPQTSGWVVMAEHLNFYRFFEQLRCVHRGKTIAEMRSSEVRRYPCEAYGFICMVHSPDGEDCGVLNHLALSTVMSSALESPVRVGARQTVAANWVMCATEQPAEGDGQGDIMQTTSHRNRRGHDSTTYSGGNVCERSVPLASSSSSSSSSPLPFVSVLSATAFAHAERWQQRASEVGRWLSEALPRVRRWGDGCSGLVDVLWGTVPVWVEGAVVGYVTPTEAARAAAALRARKRLCHMRRTWSTNTTGHRDCAADQASRRAMVTVPAVSSSSLSMLRRDEVTALHTLEVVYVPPHSKDPAGLYVFYDAGRLMRPVHWLGNDPMPCHRPVTSLNSNAEDGDALRPFPLTFVGTWEQTWLNVASVPSDLVDAVVQLNKKYDYLEPCGSDILSLTAATIPFFEHNCSPRNLFQCGLSKQTAGTQLQAQSWRKEAKLFRMYTPQRYIARTTTLDRYGLDDVDLGVNAVVAILAYTGYDMDDAVIVNHTAVQRGMLNAGVTVAKVITASGRGGGDKDEVFVFHNLLSTGERFSAELAVNGLPYLRTKQSPPPPALHSNTSGDADGIDASCGGGGGGSRRPPPPSSPNHQSALMDATGGSNHTTSSSAAGTGFGCESDHRYPSLHNNSDVYCCARRAERVDPLTNERVYEYTRHHVTKWRHFDKGEHAWVQAVVPLSFDGPDATAVLVVFRIPRPPAVGDKFSSRHGQKGTLPLHLGAVDLPFSGTAGGIVPDVLINPHAFPSRMTVGMVLEIMTGKLGAVQGRLIDHSAWSTVGESARAAESLGEALQHAGYNRYGREVLVDGVSGCEMVAEVFVGVSGYQRLRHMVSDKWQARARTDAHTFRAVTRTGQPVKGRKRHGGVRVGEMERDGLLSHGISETVMDRLLHVSDKTKAFICPECGNLLSIYERHATEYGTWKTCQFCGAGADESTDTIAMVDIPQVLRLWAAELSSIGVRVALKTSETASLW